MEFANVDGVFDTCFFWAYGTITTLFPIHKELPLSFYSAIYHELRTSVKPEHVCAAILTNAGEKHCEMSPEDV